MYLRCIYTFCQIYFLLNIHFVFVVFLPALFVRSVVLHKFLWICAPLPPPLCKSCVFSTNIFEHCIHFIPSHTKWSKLMIVIHGNGDDGICIEIDYKTCNTISQTESWLCSTDMDRSIPFKLCISSILYLKRNLFLNWENDIFASHPFDAIDIDFSDQK